MYSLVRVGRIALLASLLFNLTGGDAALTVEPVNVLSGGKLCPNTVVSFTCIAYNVRVLIWLRNNSQIEDFTNLDVPSSTEPKISGAFRVYLNSSDNDGQNNLNVTSTLVGMASDFLSGDRIVCPDSTGETLILNFTTTTPVPDDFQVSVSKGSMDNTVYFNIRWDTVFNTMYRIESYLLAASNEFINCPQMCSPSNNNPCQCSGLTAGMDGNIAITATTCGNLQGSPSEISIMPRVPAQVSSCSSYPVYNASNRLYRIETTWNQPMNPPELTPGVSQDISDYNVSDIGDSTLTNCSNTSSTCSYVYYVEPPASILILNVSARNIFGSGQEQTCSRPSSTASPTNNVFIITLSTTSLNRTVNCERQTQGSRVFTCQFCIEIDDSFTCYDLENSSNSAANTALTDLREGTYFYRVIAFLDNDPVASVYDFFSTACQLVELGASGDQLNSQCLDIPNGMVCYNGTTAGSVATYTCEAGYMLMGTAERQTCRTDGRWEGSIPSCEVIVPPWVIPLLVVSVILWVICLVGSVIIIPISIYLNCKNNNKFLTAFSYGLFVVKILVFLLIFVLWMVYTGDRNGLHRRNSVISAFVFSLVLLGLSFIDVIPVFLHLKPTVYQVQEQPEEAPEEEINPHQDQEEQESNVSDDDNERVQQHR